MFLKGVCGDFILCGLSPPVSPIRQLAHGYTLWNGSEQFSGSSYLLRLGDIAPAVRGQELQLSLSLDPVLRPSVRLRILEVSVHTMHFISDVNHLQPSVVGSQCSRFSAESQE